MLLIVVIVAATIVAYFVMSRHFFLLMLVVFLVSFAYGVYAFASPNTTDQQGLFALSLISANIGLYVLALFLGILSKISSSEECYLQRRNALLKFLGKWGGIYLVFSLLARLMLTLVTSDSVMAWFILKFYGVEAFLILVMAYHIRRFKKNQRLQRQQAT